MNFIANIWKGTGSGSNKETRKDELGVGGTSSESKVLCSEESSLKPKGNTENLLEEGRTESTGRKRKDSGSSGSTSGPDSDLSETPDSPALKDGADETENSKQSIGAGTGSSIAGDLEEVSHKAIESAKSFGSFLFSVANKAGKTVSETAKQLKNSVGESSLMGDKEPSKKFNYSSLQDTSILPWVGCEDEEMVKEQILSLSQDKKNFLRSPPSGAQFNYDHDSFLPIVKALIENDPNLESMKQDLVPKLVTEESFWKNYFYRVSLIKKSFKTNVQAEGKGSSSEGSYSSYSVSSSEESVKEKRQNIHDYEEEMKLLGKEPTPGDDHELQGFEVIPKNLKL
ncbi:synapse-associated protein of 47 kDa-like [Limulus polyphemus]|uniref:Synapse-associated protein of 47 kDa-like n=1 Tax=Limulus polyphemus TaxID=6850 RepID=A0ABM1BU39_LIMPO|nr:synapse-associated protein of 47 kDa-like [Limulus polyphemus]